jgi:hypothetical protein
VGTQTLLLQQSHEWQPAIAALRQKLSFEQDADLVEQVSLPCYHVNDEFFFASTAEQAAKRNSRFPETASMVWWCR